MKSFFFVWTQRFAERFAETKLRTQLQLRPKLSGLVSVFGLSERLIQEVKWPTVSLISCTWCFVCLSVLFSCVNKTANAVVQDQSSHIDSMHALNESELSICCFVYAFSRSTNIVVLSWHWKWDSLYANKNVCREVYVFSVELACIITQARSATWIVVMELAGAIQTRTAVAQNIIIVSNSSNRYRLLPSVPAEVPSLLRPFPLPPFHSPLLTMRRTPHTIASNPSCQKWNL